MSSPTLSKQTFYVCLSCRVGGFWRGFFPVGFYQCYMTAAIDDVERMRTEIVLNAQLQWTATTANICLSVSSPPQLHSASSMPHPKNSVWKPWRVVHPWESKNPKPMRIKKTKTRQECCLLWVWAVSCHGHRTPESGGHPAFRGDCSLPRCVSH